MEYSESVKSEAIALIKYLYKNMPTYNQIKGTYMGIQYVMNMLGLCASITEIWSDKTQNTLKNFADESGLIRADELNDVRKRIDELGTAKVKNYFLTSRFDIDFVNVKNQSYSDFIKQSELIIQVVNQIKPVTRALRKLYYIIKITTDLSLQNISLYNNAQKTIYAYRYQWDITSSGSESKNSFDRNSQRLTTLYLPYVSSKPYAKCLGSYDENGIFEENVYAAPCNTYFNLNEIKRKFKASRQNNFLFKLYATNNHGDTISRLYKFPIDELDGVTVDNDKYGIIINFNGDTATFIQSLTAILYNGNDRITDLSQIKLKLETVFCLVHETDYLYQDEALIDELNEFTGLIFETQVDGEDMFINPETEDDIYFIPENV